MEYLIQIAWLFDNRIHARSNFIVTSRPEVEIDEWLGDSGLHRLSHWKVAAQTGSNAPSKRGVLNTVHYDPSPRHQSVREGDAPSTLVIDFYLLKPVDPFKERIL